MKDTTERLLYQLKSRGPQAAATLAAACAITPMGAHKQLQSLQAQGLVEAHDEAAGVGRPKRFWRLSAGGHARFPDRHSELTVQLLGLLGEPELERLIEAREAQMRVRYAARLSRTRSLAAKARALAAIRAEEGYMARLERPAPGASAGWLLIEDHCPICAAASQCQSFCRSELALFRALLGPEVVVERVEHLVAGARRCAYSLTVFRPGRA